MVLYYDKIVLVIFMRFFIFFSPTASEKMLKAWQENEEKAAAYAQVLAGMDFWY